MRKAFLTLLMAATAATPALAQGNDGGSRGRGHRDGTSQSSEQRSEARAERIQQREQAQPQREQVQQQRVERQAEPRQQTEARSWQGRSGGERQQAVQVQQQQQQVRTESNRGSRGGNWSGGGDRNSQRFQAEREAAQRSAEQTIGGNYARRTYENERNYERDTLRREGRRDNDRRWDGNRRNNDRGAYGNGNRRSYNWSRDWRNDNRYDWQRYRYSNRSIFSPGRYYSPYSGYGYNRLSIGVVLDELFFGRNYWIDPLYYHLPPAPPGTQWVRYYDDVLLVDVYSGEVVDVIYDFFY
jgi:Nickel/cobalt transporter regulator